MISRCPHFPVRRKFNNIVVVYVDRGLQRLAELFITDRFTFRVPGNVRLNYYSLLGSTTSFRWRLHVMILFLHEFTIVAQKRNFIFREDIVRNLSVKYRVAHKNISANTFSSLATCLCIIKLYLYWPIVFFNSL